MNGNGDKKIGEMSDAELVSFLLSAPGDFLQDDSDSVSFGFWIENT